MMNRPYLVVEWNDTETSATGWLCVYNYVKGSSGGGTRMHPSVTRDEVIRLARAMAYKYQATESSTMGGCKAGICYDYKAPDAQDVLRRFLIAVSPYAATGVSIGSDLGTSYAFVLKVFEELGIGIPQTPAMRRDPKIQQGIKDFDHIMTLKWDDFFMNDMITGYGVAYAADEAWKFKAGAPGAKVVIQGFGCVGASCAQLMDKLGYKVVGVADANLLVQCDEGLDVPELIKHRLAHGEMDKTKFPANYKVRPNSDWLDVPCDILIPAALEDVINKTNADKVKASLIVEGANIPVSAEGDEILKKRGIDLVVDFVANLGAVRYYDAIIFGHIEATPEAAVKDLEYICRKNTKKLFEEAKRQNRYQREVAEELFNPTIQDDPEIA